MERTTGFEPATLTLAMCLARRYKPLTTTFAILNTSFCGTCRPLQGKVGWQNVGKNTLGRRCLVNGSRDPLSGS